MVRSVDAVEGCVMHHDVSPKLSRFNKPSKELLVDYINAKNDRELLPDQLDIGLPVAADGAGLTYVEVGLASSTGWDTSKASLAYYRIDLMKTLRGKPMVIHIPEATDAAIIAAIKSQYGILLEPEMVTFTLVTRSISDTAPIVDMAGFIPAALDTDPAPPVPLPYLDNRNYVMTFSDNHLIFYGEVQILTRRSLEVLGSTIDSLLDLREFYHDSNFDLPKVDLIIPNGELYIAAKQIPMYIDRKAYESVVYNIPMGQLIDMTTQLIPLLRKLTGSAWVSVDTDNVNFNLYGSNVLYNGFVSKDYGLEDQSYNYILAIDLGKACANLTGILKIGYHYSSSKVPGNLSLDHSSIQPLFAR